MSRILLIDPLTFMGREIMSLLPERGLADDVHCIHTQAEEEHQLGEIGGESYLISPLSDPDEIEDSSVVVVCSEGVCPRFDHLETALKVRPEIALIDAVNSERLRATTVPSAGPPLSDDRPIRIRIAHPCLVAVTIALKQLRHLHIERLAMAVVEPASAFGSQAFETLARQAAQRVQGETVQDRIGGEVLAFNMITRDPSSLIEDAAVLMPEIVTSATLTVGGCFHGHFVSLEVGLADPIDEVELIEAWQGDPSIAIAEFPVRMDTITGSDQVALSPPVLSPYGNAFALTLMFDGLLIGGATTVVSLLEEMLGN